MPQIFRLMLKRTQITPLPDGRQHVLIWLSNQGEIYVGEAFSSEEENDLLKAVVQATLQAINKALTKPITIKLVHCRQIFLTEVGQIVFIVVLQADFETNQCLLPGIALFESFTPETAAKATLKALNRTITRHL